MSDNKTIFQKLGRVLGKEADTPTFIIDPKSFADLDKDALEQKRLEAQQTLYLQNQWKKIDSELYQKAVYYEPTRIASYYDYEAMEFCIADTQIVTLDGLKWISELAAKGRDYEFITYAYDHNLKKVVPALARNAHYTRDEMTYKITFDDGKFIIATIDHRFLKRDGTFEIVENLKPGDSMMPFYRKSFYNNEKYNWVYTCNKDEGHHGWVAEHTLVAEWFYGKKVDNSIEEVHHLDFNGKNNLPENLEIMNINEHRSYHAKIVNKKLWQNPEYRAKMLEIGKRTDNKHHWNGERSGDKNPAFFHIPFDLIVDVAKKEKTLKKTATALNVSYRKLQRDIVASGYNDWVTFLVAYGIEKHPDAHYKNEKKEVIINHKIVSIVPHGVVPVYDLTVPGYKNFATDTIFSHNTPEIGVALDIFADEACTSSEQGKILTVYSESSRIKNELIDLFENKLDINTNLVSWARNLPVKEDSMIPLLNGEIVSIKEISERLKNDPEKEIWTYSIQDKTNKVLPGKIIWCDLTRKNSDIIKVTLDDDTYVETTPDHEFILRNGVHRKAEDLKNGDSLMPFYTRTSNKPIDDLVGYEKVYNPSTNHFNYTHRIVAEDTVRDSVYEKVIDETFYTHHKNFNKLDNDVNNLERLTRLNHIKLHADIANGNFKRPDIIERRMAGIDKFLRSDKRKKRMSEEMSGIYPQYFKEYNNSDLHDTHNSITINAMLSHWSNEEYKISTRDKMTLKLDDDCLNYIIKLIQEEKEFIGVHNLAFVLKNDLEFLKLFKITNIHFRKDLQKSLNGTTLVNLIKRKTLTNYYEFFASLKPEIKNNNRFKSAMSISKSKTKNQIINHKVTGIQLLTEKYDAYCMEVVGKNGEQDRHNFPICSRDKSLKISRNGVFVSNCKYGDNFIYCKIVPKLGVVGVTQLPNVEITRVEPGFTNVTTYDAWKKEKNITFYWKDKNIEFNSFEIAHFRLLGDDRRLPYGTCLAKTTCINTSDGYKEIQNITTDDMVLSFNTKTQEEEFSKVLDVIHSGQKQCYKLSTKHNFVDVSEEHKLMYYNKQTNTFKYKNTLDFKIGDLLVIDKEHNINKDVYIDKSEPEDIEKSQNYSKKNHYWDNIDLIPDHVTEEFAELFGFMIGDGSIDKNSLLFARGVEEEINERYIYLLQKFTGRIGKIDKLRDGKKTSNYRVHSKCLVTIFRRMGFIGTAHTKRIPSWVFQATTSIREAFLNGLYLADGSIFVDKWNCSRFTFELCNLDLIKDIKILIQGLGYKSGKILKRNRLTFGNYFNAYSINYYSSKLKQPKINDLQNRLTDNFILEPITSIELSEFTDTYDIYVEHPDHNFYANGIVVHNSMLEKVRRIWKQLLLSEDAMLVYRSTRAPERRVYKVFVGNMDDKDVDAYIDKIANNFKRVNIVNSNNGQQDTRYNPLAVDQDFFVPLRDPSLPMPIETLAGAQNLSEIADIEYIQKKMLAALRVPKSFLGFDESTGEGKNLAILDIRFARAVHRVQKALIQELNKIAIIHLYIKGYEDELTNFVLSLTSPSTQADMLKIENWKEKITLYRDAVSDAGNGFGAISMTKAKKEILGMSDDEIKLDIQRQAVEKAGSEELKVISETIKQTGIFREIYKIYKINPDNMAIPAAPDQQAPEAAGDEAVGGLAQDFTTPLGEPGGAPTSAPTDGSGMGMGMGGENLSEVAKRNLENRRNNINEGIKKTIADIDELLKE